MSFCSTLGGLVLAIPRYEFSSIPEVPILVVRRNESCSSLEVSVLVVPQDDFWSSSGSST